MRLHIYAASRVGCGSQPSDRRKRDGVTTLPVFLCAAPAACALSRRRRRAHSCEAAAFFLREEGVPAGVISGERSRA
eukprot:4525830-Pleurochrysis_carterae.AAC.1